MKRFYILLIITMLANVGFAQMKPKELEVIKNDTSLYYGVSRICNSPDEATESAKNELYANIAKNCNANAIYFAENGDVNRQLENIIRTFKERIDEKSIDRAITEDDDDE